MFENWLCYPVDANGKPVCGGYSGDRPGAEAWQKEHGGFLVTSAQDEQIGIARDAAGTPEAKDEAMYALFDKWLADGSMLAAVVIETKAEETGASPRS
jgi:hypothetical protein